eukprot:TRINITY_DN7638_c0_g1_i1.p1 TRINITY_DN7638_c0_g1~~TRINITY_DN7638_c0_g1_i1.p1  ORF type:complete len:362 (+),score=34.39 TRINITY_DN7638_c0_g1_i1:230-1315(+)
MEETALLKIATPFKLMCKKHPYNPVTGICMNVSCEKECFLCFDCVVEPENVHVTTHRADLTSFFDLEGKHIEVKKFQNHRNVKQLELSLYDQLNDSLHLMRKRVNELLDRYEVEIKRRFEVSLDELRQNEELHEILPRFKMLRPEKTEMTCENDFKTMVEDLKRLVKQGRERRTLEFPRFIEEVISEIESSIQKVLNSTISRAKTLGSSVKRFTKEGGLWSFVNKEDSIVFSVNKPVMINGFGIYGPIEGDVLKGTAKLCKGLTSEGEPLAECEINIEMTKRERDTLIHQVIFEQQVLIDAFECYTCAILLERGSSYQGFGGMNMVMADGVEFMFNSCKSSKNGTDAYDGQIPEIYFSARF